MSKTAQRPFKLAFSVGKYLTQAGNARRLASATRASSEAGVVRLEKTNDLAIFYQGEAIAVRDGLGTGGFFGG